MYTAPGALFVMLLELLNLLNLAGFDEHLKDRYRNAVRRVQPANVQEVTADAMQNLSR